MVEFIDTIMSLFIYLFIYSSKFLLRCLILIMILFLCTFCPPAQNCGIRYRR